MNTQEQRVAIQAGGVETQAVVIELVGPPARCGVLGRTDAFRLTGVDAADRPPARGRDLAEAVSSLRGRS